MLSWPRLRLAGRRYAQTNTLPPGGMALIGIELPIPTATPSLPATCPLTNPLLPSEAHVMVEAALAADAPWASRGHVVAREQLSAAEKGGAGAVLGLRARCPRAATARTRCYKNGGRQAVPFLGPP